MKKKTIVADLHSKLVAAGIPIHGVSFDGRIDFVEGEDGATDQQKAAAQAIVSAYDQDAEETEKARKKVTAADIDGAKTVDELKVLLKKMLKD